MPLVLTQSILAVCALSLLDVWSVVSVLGSSCALKELNVLALL